MDARANEVLAYIEANAAQVEAHDGAAYPERELLRAIVEGSQSGAAGLLGDAYQADLARAVPVINDRAQARGMSHKIFFASDFGRRQLSGMDGYGGLLDALIEQHQEDTDTLGELLLCCKYIGNWSVTAQNGYSIFENAWAMLDRDDFARSYHAILVGGLLFALME